MTREQIEKRLAELRANFNRLQADLNATGGAIQDCEYWLGVLEKEGQGEGEPLPRPESDAEA